MSLKLERAYKGDLKYELNNPEKGFPVSIYNLIENIKNAIKKKAIIFFLIFFIFLIKKYTNTGIINTEVESLTKIASKPTIAANVLSLCFEIKRYNASKTRIIEK